MVAEFGDRWHLGCYASMDHVVTGRKDAIQKILLNRNTHGSFVSMIDGDNDIIITARGISRDEQTYAVENGVTPGKKTIENNSYPYVTEVMASVCADVDRSSTAYQLFYQLAAGRHNAIVKESGYIVCKR